jgi:hypothetical protein
MNRYSHKLIATVALFALSSGIAHAQILNPVVTNTLGLVQGIGSSNALSHTGGNGNALGLFNGPVGTGIFHSQLGNLTNVGQGNLNGLLSSGDHGHRITSLQLVGDVGPVNVNVLNGLTPDAITPTP